MESQIQSESEILSQLESLVVMSPSSSNSMQGVVNTNGGGAKVKSAGGEANGKKKLTNEDKVLMGKCGQDCFSARKSKLWNKQLVTTCECTHSAFPQLRRTQASTPLGNQGTCILKSEMAPSRCSKTFEQPAGPPVDESCSKCPCLSLIRDWSKRQCYEYFSMKHPVKMCIQRLAWKWRQLSWKFKNKARFQVFLFLLLGILRIFIGISSVIHNKNIKYLVQRFLI